MMKTESSGFVKINGGFTPEIYKPFYINGKKDGNKRLLLGIFEVSFGQSQMKTHAKILPEWMLDPNESNWKTR